MPLPEEIISTFPEEIRQDPSWQKFNDVGSVAKSYLEIQKLNGSAIRLPDKDAKPEDAQKWWSETRGKLAERGFIEVPPATVDDYKLPAIEGFTPDPELTGSYIRDVAHATGMTPKQVEANLKFHHQMNQAAAQKLFVTPEAAEADLKQKLGNDYAGVKSHVEAGLAAMEADNPTFADAAKRTYVVELDGNGRPGKLVPYNNHWLTMGLLELHGENIREDHSEGQAPLIGNETLESIDSQINDIRYNEQNALHKRFLANDDEAVEKVEKLYKIKAALLKRNGKAA